MPNLIWRIYFRMLYLFARTITSFVHIPLHGSLVAIWQEGRVLLVQKSYQKGWALPGGLRKRGDSWRQTAVRETMEEVGVHIDEGQLVFVKEVLGDLGPCNRTCLYEIEINHPVDLKCDGREILRAEFVLPKEALKKDLNRNAKAYLASLPERA